MSNIWEVGEEGGGIYFAQSNVSSVEKISNKSGNPYTVMEITLVPFDPEKQIIIENYFPKSTPLNEVVIPSVLKLVEAGKIQSPTDLENDVFVAYKWTEYKSRTRNDIKYWQDKNPDMLGADERGYYKLRKAIEFVDVFKTQEEWQKAAELAQQENGNDGNGNGVAVQQPAQPDPMIEAARVALPQIVQACGTDMAKLQASIQHPPLNTFNINSKEIKDAVVGYITKIAVSDMEKQAAMIAEVNSHFNGDTPYLVEADFEIAF